MIVYRVQNEVEITKTESCDEQVVLKQSLRMANVDMHNSTTLQVFAVDNLWPCSMAKTSCSSNHPYFILSLYTFICLFVCSFNWCLLKGSDTYNAEQLPVWGLVLAISVAAVTSTEVPAAQPVNGGRNLWPMPWPFCLSFIEPWVAKTGIATMARPCFWYE